MAYAFSRAITIDAAKLGGATQTDFALLFAGTYAWLKTSANGGDLLNASGNDFAFFSDVLHTVPLKYEKVWHVLTTGEVACWIKVPSLSHLVNSVIYVGYGDAAVVSSQADPTNVWTSDHKAVYHLEDGTTLSGADSTSNALTLTGVGTPTAGVGKVGGGAVLNGSSQHLRAGSPSIAHTDSVTISAWFKATSLSSTGTIATVCASASDLSWFRLFASGTAKVSADVNGSAYAPATGATTLSTGTWYFGAARFQSDTSRDVLLNGVIDGSDLVSNGSPLSGQLDRVAVGVLDRPSITDYFPGSIDQVRVRLGVVPVATLLAEYNNQSDPATFYSIGAPSGGGPSAAAIARYRRDHLLIRGT